MTRSISHQSGFTLMELIVATAITVLMIGLVTNIFNSTTRAVSTGTQKSEMIGKQRVIGDGLELETRKSSTRAAMVGPNSTPAGFLVILQKTIPNIHDTLKDKENGAATHSVRSDQLVFIFDQGLGGTDLLRPVCPASSTTFDSDLAPPESRYVRIWYGHVLKTNGAGTAATGLGASGPNEFASQWMLGREALFLRGGTPTGVYSAGAAYNANVTVYNEPLYKGYADISAQDLDALTGASGTLDISNAGTAAAYRAAAYQYTYGYQLPWANPAPGNFNFDSSQIAQMHSAFMANVSDFIVEFAADISDDLPTVAPDGQPDGEPDRDTVTGDIKWYSGIAHSGSSDDPMTYVPGSYAAAESGSLPANADAAFVWGHTGSAGAVAFGSTTNVWPYMLRIRYRLHDQRGELIGRELSTSQKELGQWYEIIVPVNRD